MDWIAGWNKRIKLTISGSCIEGDLSDFPVMIHLDSTCSGVFNELGSNSKRISIVASDQQQCNVEVERWDESTKNAWLWVNVPTLISGVNSDVYLYYDNLRPDNSAYVGTVGETPAKNVWDDNFVGVWHMNQDPTGAGACIKDSTSNVISLTPNGSMVSGDLVDGKIGKALNFNGSDEYLISAIDTDLHIVGDITIEVIIKRDTTLAAVEYILSCAGTGESLETNYLYGMRADSSKQLASFHEYGSGVNQSYSANGTDICTNSFIAVAISRDVSSNELKYYLDGVYNQSDTYTNDPEKAASGNLQTLFIGKNHASDYFEGPIDEVRISDIARSASWIKATYYSNWNQLINYGNEETVSSGILPGWGNRLKLTIQNDHIDNTLTDFPVMIKVSNSSGFNSYDNRDVFYELEANINRKKIAITDSTGVLQCFVEIERFSCAETEAVLWTKLPVIYDSVGTHFYLYYDKTKADNVLFVGDVNSIVAQNVWDDNFVGVWHMNQDPTGGSNCIKDSTGNTNHGTPEGAMTSGDLVDGKVGKALDFDGAGDNINCGNTVNISNNLSVFVIPKTSNQSSINAAASKYKTSTPDRSWLLRLRESTIRPTKWAVSISDDGTFDAGHCKYYYSSGDVVDGNYHLLGFTFASGTLKLYCDGAEDTSVTKPQDDAITSIYIGDADVTLGATHGATNPFFGILDEVCISNTIRSVPWIKATYHSNWDSLIVYEKEDITASWLDDWAKRIKLTIDHTKIDSSLTDFPVLVTLTSGVQSDFFSELEYGSVDDDFTGLNGSVPNSDLYSGNAKISNNKLYLDTSGSYGGIKSKYKLSGDFDIQVDFNDVTFPSVNSWAFNFYVNGEDETRYNIRIEYSGSSLRYHSYRDGTQGYLADAVVGTSDSSGKFKITREGNTFKGYQWSGSAWVQNGTGLTINGLGSTKVGFSISTWDTPPFAAGNFDNFKVNFGTVIWPEGAYPNRKKITVTKNNGTTQCPVEIEQFDVVNGVVNLWTKIPTVVFDNDTDIYLYYDSSKDDNDSYVGDVGSTPGKAVWDDNFVGVWHMNQDPNGDPANAIKDSTSNSNHGTPGGSMTSGDLVDGKVGKALDFDGSNDHVACGNFGNFGQNDSWTISVIVKKVVDASGVIVGKHNKTVTDGFMYESRGGGEHKQAAYLTSDPGANYSWTIRRMGSVSLNDGIWHDTAFTYNGSGAVSGIKFFTDGAEDSYTDVATGDISSGITSTTPVNIGRLGSADNEIDADIDEVRISNIARSASWIKATYHSNWNTLLTYDSFQNYTPPPDYYYHGYVKEEGVYVSRKLYIYRRDTGALVDSCMSNAGTGYYLLETSVSGEHFVVALDDDAGDDYNALVQDRIYPNGM